MNIKKDSLILPWLSNSFENINKQENKIRTQSILFLNSDSKLQYYVELIEISVNTLLEFCYHFKHPSKDELTIQLLGIRLLNSILSSLKLILSGYYQISTSIIRDIYETGFLLDFFRYKPEEIKLWRKSTDKIRMKKYSPKKIREVLDKRDESDSKKRLKKYKFLCEQGTHPTYSGFKLLGQDGTAKLGPFYNDKYLKALVEELILIVPRSVAYYLISFKSSDLQHIKIQLNFYEKYADWIKKRGGADYWIDLIKSLKEELKKASAKGI